MKNKLILFGHPVWQMLRMGALCAIAIRYEFIERLCSRKIFLFENLPAFLLFFTAGAAHDQPTGHLDTHGSAGTILH